MRSLLCVLTSLTLLNPLAVADEPALPAGLGGDEKGSSSAPALPAGLGGAGESADEPGLPAGLGATDEPNLPAPPEDEPQNLFETLPFTGFWEIRGGVRTQEDPGHERASLGETRLQLEYERTIEKFTFKLVTDLYYDAVLDRHSINLERGEGFLDLREASVAFTPVEFMDVKIGRQVLTWGTGDLVFLNDLFPKDWQSFLMGRDVEYLKGPSDAVKLSMFSDLANWDVVFVPRFDPDRFISGARASYYNQMMRRRVGRDGEMAADIPNTWFEDHEWHTRISKNIQGVELAAYGYWGRWKSPGGFDLFSQKATFPRLAAYGGSIRGPVAGGVANFEAVYYDSQDDRAGDDPFVNNSEIRLLAGYERQMPELMDDLTLAGQYYVEWMMDYDAYRETLWPIVPAAEQSRHVITLRVTKLLMNQNLELSLFTFFSPTDSDAYMRPRISYKLDDHWKAEIGGNVFFGQEPHTFYNQFGFNSNAYVALRYSF